MSKKEILIIGSGSPDDYEDESIDFGQGNRVVVKDIDPTSGEKLRGYSPDLIILATPVSSEVKQRVIEPMVAIGGNIIELY